MHVPSEWFKLDLSESEDGFLEESTNPDFFPFWCSQCGRSGDFRGERQIKREMSECDHEQVSSVIPTDLIKNQVRARRPYPTHAQPSEARRERP